jgi:FixJ family two-component response regulator
MSLVVSGMLNKQIAAELDASEATVKMHRSQAMKKMHAKPLPELVRMADKLKSIPCRLFARIDVSLAGISIVRI